MKPISSSVHEFIPANISLNFFLFHFFFFLLTFFGRAQRAAIASQ
jgi:hypothetical protein